jgi:hypothetical protein
MSPVTQSAPGVGVRTLLGAIPHRIALAGGWIDQPFLSALNPEPRGSMVVVSLEPDRWFMDRAGIASGTRRIARRLWGDELPKRPKEALVRELYAAENADLDEPSGSQDMIGLVYPGVSRLDYDIHHEGGYFPAHIESCRDAEVARWFERVLQVVAVSQRPEGYNPLGVKHLAPAWIARLGASGRACYDAIVARDLSALGASMNECMRCWETLLPHVVSHPTLRVDLKAVLAAYQAEYPGAMYSGCGGGYLLIASERDVPGAFRVKVRTR